MGTGEAPASPAAEILTRALTHAEGLFPWQFSDGLADGLLKQNVLDRAGIGRMDALAMELFQLGAYRRGKLTFVEDFPKEEVKKLVVKEKPTEALAREDHTGRTFASFRAGVEWLAQCKPVEVLGQVELVPLHTLAVYVPEVLLDGEGEPLLCACVTNSDRCSVRDLARARLRQQIRVYLQAAYPYYQRSIEAAAGRRKKSAKDVVFRLLRSAPVSKEMADEALRILAAVDPSLRDIRAGERRMAARAALMASGTQVIFSNVQLAILATLKGRARSLEELAADIDMSRRTVEDNVRELTDMGLVKHKPGRGYYSTQEPPPDLDILGS